VDILYITHITGVIKVKILIPTIGTRGDVQPYINIARELVKRGDKVTIATHPYWKDLVEENKLEHLSIGQDLNIEKEAAIIRGNAKIEILAIIKTFQFIFKILKETSGEILNIIDDFDAVIVVHSFLGANECQLKNKKYVSISLQPFIVPEKKEKKTFMGLLFGKCINNAMVSPFNKLRKKYNLKKINTLEDLLSDELNIFPISGLIFPRIPDWPKQHVLGGFVRLPDAGQSMSEKITRFIGQYPNPIIVALGAMGFDTEKEIKKLLVLIEAIKQTGNNAIIQGFHNSIKKIELPSNMIHTDSEPHNILFPKCKMIIHHCGFGTTVSVLYSGKPSICIPHILDQFFWAQKLYEIKTAPMPVKSKKLTKEILIAAIKECESENIKRNAIKVRDKLLHGDNSKNTVELITTYLNKYNVN